MCAVLNHEVLSLKRISIGNIKLGYLKRGEWRELNKEEISYLNDL
ncbi:16S rRNA U516 pseudouridylate synthase RsuA-like enzyme [Clostridium saccharobutylicum]|nr:16S rRNA U516 pseudouridylate synthase RsuA-like enzyme [Clostridium saccharobutylicum]